MTTGELTAVPIDYPLDSLVSFHYYRDDKSMQQVVATKRLRMIGDSGAFSAFTQGTPIKMGEYVAWCRQWSPYLCWTATLDVIGDPQATLANWRTMRDRHHLQTVPTLHVGTDPRWMDAYVADGCDFFGLGGMVGRAIQALPWVVRVFRYARDHHPQVRFHIWGITHRQFLDNLPAYSADSSTFGNGYRFGRLGLFDPVTGHVTNMDLRPAHNRQSPPVWRYGRLIRERYGMDPAVVERCTVANRHLVIQLAARSNQLYAGWLQQRHQVTPPAWGLRHPQHLPTPAPAQGPHVHAVTARAGGRTDDLVTAVGLGTRIHAVDARAAHLSVAADGRPA